MTLADGLAALGLVLPAATVSKLEGYLALLTKWNRVYNLTAIRRPEEMLTHHLLDSLSVLPVILSSVPEGSRVRLADIGSGAGLPGLVLALACPDWTVVSVETVEKKAAFQRQVAIELGLANVSIHCGRVEDMNGCFDCLISRAFASLTDFIGLAGHLSGRLWAMKGAYPADELALLPANWQLAARHDLLVPGLTAKRCLLRLEKR